MQIQKQQEGMVQLEDKLSKNTEFLKVKPKRKLKDLQTQEKLVSQKKPKIFVENQKIWRKRNSNEQLQNNKNVQKVKRMNYNVNIKSKWNNQKLSQQNKNINQQYNLKKNIATQNAIRKGEKEGELKRMKERARIQNLIIGNTKRTMTPQIQNTSTYEESINSSPRSPGIVSKNDRAALQIKYLIQKQNYTQFYIKKKYGADLPVNYKPEPYKVLSDNHERIEKILSVKKKNPHDILPSLTELYDQNLKEQDKASTQKSDQELIQERLKKKQFILEKLEESTH